MSCLQSIYARFREEGCGLDVLAFPTQQLGDMAANDNAVRACVPCRCPLVADWQRLLRGPVAQAILQCIQDYGLTFPIMAPVTLQGPGADPLFLYLRHQAKVWYPAAQADGVQRQRKEAI